MLDRPDASGLGSHEDMNSVLLQTKNLTKLYGFVMGVNDLTLEVTPGVHGLLGPNGAGKSTLLKLMTGQLRPTEGWVEVLGQRPWNNPELLARIGFCPEQDAFYDFMSAFDFVTALACLSGLGRKVAREKAALALERCGATEYMHRKIGTYSRGMRQRTKVAQALVHDPDLLILDEPLTATDPIGRHDLMNLVKTLGAEGKSIIVSSHVLHEVEAMTDEFLLIYGGRVLASGNIREIRALMDEYPHQIVLRCDQPQRLARQVLLELPVSGLQIDEDAKTLSIHTRSPHAFYSGIPKVALEAEVQIAEMKSEDDNLQAVFNYLVGAD